MGYSNQDLWRTQTRSFGITFEQNNGTKTDVSISIYKKYLRRNKFQPFSITDGMKDAYKDLAKEFNIPNPLNRSVIKRIKKILLKRQNRILFRLFYLL